MSDIDPSTIPTAASRAPIHLGAVGLIARDVMRLADYYSGLLGLNVLQRSAAATTLGIDGVALLELSENADALPDDPREGGLYHTAFLMPTRADLARWILHAAHTRVPITGASDHDVSEAIYLDDPEGNGIEVYSDRPQETWRRDGALIFQKTEALDIDAILREVEGRSSAYSAPAGLRVGHIHLRVGDIDAAEAFYCGALGLDVTRRRSGATFVSSGGYHHHVAVNVWHSERSGVRDAGRSGLAWFGLELSDALTRDAVRHRLETSGVPVADIPGGFAADDPWGTRIRFTVAQT